MDTANSLFDRLFGRTFPVWAKVLVSLLLILSPFAAAYLDDALVDFLYEGHWRVFLLAPAIVVYIWLISPLMMHMESGVIRSMREVVELDEESYNKLVHEASQVNPMHEGVAIAVGIGLGILSALATDIDQQLFWLRGFWFLSTALMYGVLSWMIFLATASTRINNSLHRQPLRVDILNTSPFEVIGRQSLLLALVFIGGITISLILSFQDASITSIEFWLVYLILILITMTIFFLNMRPTHKVLQSEKNHELETLQEQINQSIRKMASRLKDEEEMGQISAQINALVIYEQRLLGAQTWPINTSILRTLVFSVFVPLLSFLARLAMDLVTG
jgi:hypothetical protein